MLILGPPTVGQLRVGRNLAQFNPHPVYVNEMAPALWDVAVEYGIDPLVMLAQSGKETGWGRFVGKVPVTFHNTCGLKIYDPSMAGDQESTMAHDQSASWREGAIKHAQHLSAYLQMRLFSDPLLDPRWVHVYGKKPAIAEVEQLSGRWAPDPPPPAAPYGPSVAETAAKLAA